MIVVSNTSPLTNLASIGQFEVLQRLYKQLEIAEAVWDELNWGGKQWPGRDDTAKADWIHRNSIKNRDLVAALMRDLDRGEAESIALALELKADLVLLDEQEGRHAAQRLGLHVVGVVGILLEAKAAGVIDKIRPSLDALRQNAGFYLSDALYQAVLVLGHEEIVTTS